MTCGEYIAPEEQRVSIDEKVKTKKNFKIINLEKNEFYHNLLTFNPVFDEKFQYKTSFIILFLKKKQRKIHNDLNTVRSKIFKDS